MACPKCGCRVTYPVSRDDFFQEDYERERCSVCGHIFYTIDNDDND
jgi:hypothetical protein